MMRRRKLFNEGVRRTKSILKSSGPDADYGFAEPLDGLISDEELKQKKLDYLKQLDKVNKEELECMTRGQNLSHEWHNERKKRLTASNFGDICKMRKNTSCQKKVYYLLYKPQVMCKEMTYGVQMEPLARYRFEKLNDVVVKKCGLFSDKELSYLAATPGNCFEFSLFLITYLIIVYIFVLQMDW